MTENIKEMLLTLGYSNITEDSLNYRMKPIYRDSDSNTVLSVRKDTGYFIDFSKQISGSFEDLVKISLNLKHPIEAKDWIQERKVTNSYKKEESKPVIKEPRTFSKDSLKNLIPDHTYSIDRGISVSTLEIFNGGVANAGRMKGRYIFPIFDYKKNFIGASGRLVNQSNTNAPKWKHVGDKKLWKYPCQVNNKIIRHSKEVFLVESIGDMLSLWDAKVQNCMVTFGLEISIEIINYLLRIDVDNIHICFNNDADNNSAGNIAAQKANKKLKKYFDPHQVHINLPTKNDFGEMNYDEIISWRNQIKQHICQLRE